MHTILHTIEHFLTTTHTVCQQLDLARSVAPEVVEECIEIALQAPTSANQQKWHFVVVTDRDKRTAIAKLFRKAVRSELGDLNGSQLDELSPSLASTLYLAKHLHQVPVLIIPCITWRADKDAGVYVQADLYGSVLPAAWSLMLALRVRGLASAWTTWHLMYEQEVAQLLGIPATVTQAVMLPVAYCTDDGFQAAKRIPGRAVTSWNRWGARRD